MCQFNLFPQNIGIRRNTPDWKIQNGEGIEYYIGFPYNHTFPKVTRITFQDKLWCVGPPESGDNVTALKAEDVLDVKIVDVLTTKKPPSTPFVQIVINNIIKNEEHCGENSEYESLVVRGQPVKNGEFPWLVALFMLLPDGGYKFRCAGSLVSKKHVITAAHCVTEVGGRKLDKDNFIIVLGKSNIKRWAQGSVLQNVNEIFVHPDYKEPSNGDIAVMRMENEVEFKPSVRPICVWNEHNA